MEKIKEVEEYKKKQYEFDGKGNKSTYNS